MKPKDLQALGEAMRAAGLCRARIKQKDGSEVFLEALPAYAPQPRREASPEAIRQHAELRKQLEKAGISPETLDAAIDRGSELFPS